MKTVKKKPPRKKTPDEIEADVLTKSVRRCTLCFYLKGTLRKKHGQIAHLNKDRTDYRPDNLAFMCLKHHTIFDSRASQHKNYTLKEVKDARARLYEAIAKGQHIKRSDDQTPAGRETDRQTLSVLKTTMREAGTMDWLRKANFAGWSFEWDKLEGIERVAERKGPEHEFIDADLERRRKKFFDAGRSLLTLLATETFPVGNGNRQSIPEDWEDEQPDRFRRVVSRVFFDDIPIWLTRMDWTAMAEIQVISQKRSSGNVSGEFRVLHIYEADEQKLLTGVFVRMYAAVP